MANLRFGAFLAPHHPIGENPTLQFQSNLELVQLLDHLGYEEFWCGEHHSTGWEIIASPELFLAAAAERTQRIKLGTGVVSLPYHHPFMVAQRMVQLDHQSRGRVIFGSGPGALPSDAHTLGIDPMVLRDRQDEAMSIIRRLFTENERFSYESEWFKLNDAKLQLKPLSRGHGVRGGVNRKSLRHDARGEAPRRGALDRLADAGRHTRAAAAMELRGGISRKAWQHG